MSGNWQFVLVRLRDDYNTMVTVPKSECSTIEAARERVWENFDPALWRIGVEAALSEETK